VNNSPIPPPPWKGLRSYAFSDRFRNPLEIYIAHVWLAFLFVVEKRQKPLKIQVLCKLTVQQLGCLFTQKIFEKKKKRKS
jgi:hypothetical protein